jgi:hypothetical protein
LLEGGVELAAADQIASNTLPSLIAALSEFFSCAG